MSRWRVLVTRHVYPQALEILRQHADIDYRDSRYGLAPDELRAAVVGKHAVVCQLTDPVDASVIEAGRCTRAPVT